MIPAQPVQVNAFRDDDDFLEKNLRDIVNMVPNMTPEKKKLVLHSLVLIPLLTESKLRAILDIAYSDK